MIFIRNQFTWSLEVPGNMSFPWNTFYCPHYKANDIFFSIIKTSNTGYELCTQQSAIYEHKTCFLFSHCNISFDKKSESKKHSFLSGVKSKCKLIRKFNSTSFFSSLTQIIIITVIVWFKITFSEFLFSSNFLYSLLPPHCKFNFTDLLVMPGKGGG